MKRLLVFATVLFLCFSFSACNGKTIYENTDRTPVVINIPNDNTVNGYRTDKATSNNDDIVDASSVKVGNPDISSSNGDGNETFSSGEYCVNINTGVFHKSTCASVGKIKEENKAYISDRNKLISEGYKPCKRCNP